MSSADYDAWYKDKLRSVKPPFAYDTGAFMYGKPLRNRMRVQFGLTLGFFLFVTFIICLSIGLSTTATVKNDSESALEDQVKRHVEDFLRTTSDLVGGYLSGIQENIVNVLSQATRDVLDPNFGLADVNSYFNYNIEDLQSPVTSNVRTFSATVGFGSSTYYWPNTAATAPLLLPTAPYAEAKYIVDRTAHLDPYMKAGYNGNPDVFAIYVGFEHRSLFRRYPGRTTVSIDPTRSYDPKARDWYTTAAAGDSAINHISSPYQDAHNSQWMITMSRKVTYSNGSTIGVVGVDILLVTLTRAIQRIQVLQSGRATLFEADGTVVADKDWTASATSPRRYTDLTSPSISSSVWSWIASTPTGSERSREEGDYLLSVSHMSAYLGRYYLMIAVPRSEILAPMQPILDDVKTVNGILGGVLTACFVAILIIKMILIEWTAGALVTPITLVKENVEMMVSNIGKPSLTEGVKSVGGGLGSEQVAFVQSFNDMMESLSKKREEASAEVDNEFYGGTNPLLRTE